VPDATAVTTNTQVRTGLPGCDDHVPEPGREPAALLPRMSLQVLTAAGAGGERNRLALELTRLHRPAGGNGRR